MRKKKTVKKAAPKKVAKNKVIRKKPTVKKVGKKISKVGTQIGAIKSGSKFINFNGFTIEKKPYKIGKKTKYVFICSEIDQARETLPSIKQSIKYYAK